MADKHAVSFIVFQHTVIAFDDLPNGFCTDSMQILIAFRGFKTAVRIENGFLYGI